MALLEVHDTVDMADFSELTSAYRSRKEKDKQEWAELESHFVNLHPAEGVSVSELELRLTAAPSIRKIGIGEASA